MNWRYSQSMTDIKCPYCDRFVPVAEKGFKENLKARLGFHRSRSDNALCYGSDAPVRGNWRDDPTCGSLKVEQPNGSQR